MKRFRLFVTIFILAVFAPQPAQSFAIIGLFLWALVEANIHLRQGRPMRNL